MGTSSEVREDGSGGRAEQRRLLLAAGAGDAGAFERFYDLTCARVHALSLLVTRDPVAAAGLTRAAYLEAWRCASAYDPEGIGPLAWVLSIAQAVGREARAAA